MPSSILKKVALSLFCLSSQVGLATMTGTEYDEFGNDDPLASKSVVEDQITPPHRVITPAGGTKIKTGADAFIIGQFLEWEARQDGLTFARTGIAPSSNTSTAIPQGTSYAPSFQFDPGFRVGLGLGLEHDDWDVLFVYTWYHQNAPSNSITHTNNAVDSLISGMSFPYALPSTLTYARGDWHLRLSVIDGTLGRVFLISPYLTLRPVIGLKAAWQNQNYNVAYRGITNSVNYQNDIDQAEKAFGIGFRMGLKTIWNFTRNWSIHGYGFGDILSTRFKVHSSNVQFPVNNSSAQTTRDQLETKTSTLQPIVELSLSLCWDNWFDDERYHFGLSAGWEEQIWFNNNHLLIDNGSSNVGNLYLQGLIVSARFDF